MLRTALLLVLTLLTMVGPVRADEPVKMMTNTWPPYVDPTLPEQGLAAELVTHIFTRAGYSVENTIESWPQALEGVRTGLSDVLGAAWRDDARDQRFIYSEPYLMNELIVVKRLEMKGRHYSIGALADSRIGLVPDYAYGINFTELPGVEIVYENDITENLTKLLNNEVDFVVGDRRVIAMKVDEFLKDRRQEIEVASISLPPRALYVAGSRATERPARLVEEFNSALLDVKRDGSYQKIIEKWQARYPL
jgi:polar amino acid transport system substrate-binding protein